MAFDYGLSFQPGTDSGTGQGSEPATSPLQSAVKLLSLRLPSVVGAQALAPDALLRSSGSAGLGDGGSPDAMLELLRKLLMQSQAAMPPTAGRLGRGPDPRVPSFGGPDAPSERPQTPGLPQLPMPSIRPGDDPAPPDTPATMSPAPSAGVPSPFDVQNPFARPGRNPRLAEKAGFDIDEYHRG
jgi:hypothetical protein